MKKIAALALLFAGYVLAQNASTFASIWPIETALVQNIHVTKGADANGQPDGTLYIRNGWGECLVLRTGQFQTFADAVPINSYLRILDYADSVSFEVERTTYRRNCPLAPREVKPTWRGSRPTFEYRQEVETQRWIKGRKTEYRASPLAACGSQRVKTATGSDTNYSQISFDQTVADANGIDVVVGSIEFSTPYKLMAVCRDVDVAIGDYRFTELVALSWSAPTLNDDGSPLTDLAGFRVYQRTAQLTRSHESQSTSAQVELLPGLNRFTVTTLTQAGVESLPSNEIVR